MESFVEQMDLKWKKISEEIKEIKQNESKLSNRITKATKKNTPENINY